MRLIQIKMEFHRHYPKPDVWLHSKYKHRFATLQVRGKGCILNTMYFFF